MRAASGVSAVEDEAGSVVSIATARVIRWSLCTWAAMGDMENTEDMEDMEELAPQNKSVNLVDFVMDGVGKDACAVLDKVKLLVSLVQA